jgi:hypothetical protein
MSWIIDNAGFVYLLLGLVATGNLVAFWLTKRVKYLLIAGGVVALIALFWLLTRLVPTDRKLIESGIYDMADAFVAQRTDDLFKHVSKDFTFAGENRAQFEKKVRSTIQHYKVNDVRISQVDVKEVAKDSAKAEFRATAFSSLYDGPFPMRCKADFVREGTQWKLRAIEFFAFNSDQPLHIPWR